MRNRRTRRLNESSKTQAAVLKGISRLPKDMLVDLFDTIEANYVRLYDNVHQFMVSEGYDLDPEDLFWLGARSQYAPKKDNEYVIYDYYNGEVIGLDSSDRHFTSADVATMLKKGGFDVTDPDGLADLLADYVDMSEFRAEMGI